LTKEEREVETEGMKEGLDCRKKGRGIALKREEVGWCGMGLVGKPMGKSKWVGVELISYSSEKGPTLLPILLFC